MSNSKTDPKKSALLNKEDLSAKQAQLLDKAKAFLQLHSRVVEDFERSLTKARHYLSLVRIALEKEPAEALSLLKQIEETELSNHLEQQFEAYESIADQLEKIIQTQPQKELSLQISELLPKLRENYLTQLRESEEQQQIIQILKEKLAALKTNDNKTNGTEHNHG